MIVNVNFFVTNALVLYNLYDKLLCYKYCNPYPEAILHKAVWSSNNFIDLTCIHHPYKLCIDILSITKPLWGMPGSLGRISVIA